MPTDADQPDGFCTGPWRKRELVSAVMPDNPLEYAVGDVGESKFRSLVKVYTVTSEPGVQGRHILDSDIGVDEERRGLRVVPVHREGHLGAALLVYAPLGFVATVAGADEIALIDAVAAAGLAMAPDIDLRLPGILHRGPTHTVWFAGVVGVASGFVGVLIGAGTGLLEAISLGAFAFLVSAGTVISLLAADALTPAGIRPFAPQNDRKYTYGVVRAANPIANYALLAIGLVAAAGSVGLATRLTPAIGF